MADTRKITIEIVNKESSTPSNPSTPSDIVVQTTNNINITTQDNSKSMLAKAVLVNQAYEQAKKLIVQSATAGVSRYFTLSENYMAENTLSNVKTAISKVGGLTNAVIGGAMVGGPLGVGVAVVGWGVSEYLSYQSRMSSYYQSLNASNYGTSFARTRAGLSNGGKGTEN